MLEAALRTEAPPRARRARTARGDDAPRGAERADGGPREAPPRFDAAAVAAAFDHNSHQRSDGGGSSELHAVLSARAKAVAGSSFSGVPWPTAEACRMRARAATRR